MDQYGHVEELVYIPVLNKINRGIRQTKVGYEGILGDVGGHIQACSLGGTCHRFNLFPQNRKFNNGVYKKLENSFRRNLQAGNEIGLVRTRFVRPKGNNVRPSEVGVSYTINGEPYYRRFINAPGQKGPNIMGGVSAGERLDEPGSEENDE